MKRKFHARFWRPAGLVRDSLSLIHNAAINIKNRAEGHPVLKAKRLLSNSRIGLEAYTVLEESV